MQADQALGLEVLSGFLDAVADPSRLVDEY